MNMTKQKSTEQKQSRTDLKLSLQSRTKPIVGRIEGRTLLLNLCCLRLNLIIIILKKNIIFFTSCGKLFVRVFYIAKSAETLVWTGLGMRTDSS